MLTHQSYVCLNFVTPLVVSAFYSYTLNDEGQMEKFLNPEDAGSLVELSKVINFIAEKLRTLCYLEDMVNVIQNSNEGEMFCMELTSFLRELCINSLIIHLIISAH